MTPSIAAPFAIASRFDASLRGAYAPLSMSLETALPKPGRRVRVTQQIAQRDRTWTNTIEGVITRFQQSKTGSWFAHSKDDRLWLDRLELRLDDGEVTILNLDQYSAIEEV